MSDAKGREPNLTGEQMRPPATPALESVDSAFAAAVEPKLPPPEPMNLAAPTVRPSESPRASGLSHAVFLLGGVGLALLGGLMLRGNDDAASAIAALRREAEASATQTDTRLKAADGKAVAAAEMAAKGLDGQSKALAGLDKRVKSAELALASVPDPAPVAAAPDLSGLTGAIAAVEAKSGGLEGRIGKIETQLAAPKTPLQATEVKIEPTAPTTATMAAQLVLAQSLQNALERGSPFAAEMAALENLGVDTGRLAPLAALSAQGAPSLASLGAEWKKLAPSLFAATAPEAPKSQNWMDKITNGAASLVTIRRDTDPPADNAAGAVAAVDAALASGNMAALDSAYAALPAKAQELSKAWFLVVKNRIGSLETARALVADAIARLAAKKQ